jgi:hypothetical protein
LVRSLILGRLLYLDPASFQRSARVVRMLL